MARIKHIAIRTPYPEKTAAFYKDVFGLKEVGQARAGESPRDAAGYTGIHHLGFMVDDIGSCPLGPHVQESRRCSASRRAGGRRLHAAGRGGAAVRRWNKRPTVCYMAKNDAGSIADCREALARNPNHF